MRPGAMALVLPLELRATMTANVKTWMPAQLCLGRTPVPLSMLRRIDAKAIQSLELNAELDGATEKLMLQAGWQLESLTHLYAFELRAEFVHRVLYHPENLRQIEVQELCPFDLPAGLPLLEVLRVGVLKVCCAFTLSLGKRRRSPHAARDAR